MFCNKCGQKLDEHAVFCGNCGASCVVDVKQTKNIKKINKKLLVGLGVGGVFVAGLIVGIILLLTVPKTINLNDYIKVEFEGYDTLGTAYAIFDEKAFLRDYEDIIEFKNSKMANQYRRFYSTWGNDAAEEVLNVIKVEVSDNYDLCNDDVISLEWTCDEDIISTYFNVRVEYEESEYIVEGLEELEEFDPFEDLDVYFEGYSPNISISYNLTSSKEFYNELAFYVEKSTYLKAGEEIEIYLEHIDGMDLAEYLSTYGLKATQTEKKYVIEGDGYYITSSAEIPEDVLEDMHQQSKDMYTAYMSNLISGKSGWSYKINSIDYVGNVFLTAKEGYDLEYPNNLSMVYKVNLYLKYTGSYWYDEGTYNCYMVVNYDSIRSTNDGECGVDYNQGYLPENCSLKITTDSYKTLTWHGVVDYDDFVTDCINPYVDRYIYEDNLRQYMQ